MNFVIFIILIYLGKLNSIKRKEKGKNPKKNVNGPANELSVSLNSGCSQGDLTATPEFTNTRNLETEVTNEDNRPPVHGNVFSRSNVFQNDTVRDVNAFAGNHYSYHEQRQTFQAIFEQQGNHSTMHLPTSDQTPFRDGFYGKYDCGGLSAGNMLENGK